MQDVALTGPYIAVWDAMRAHLEAERRATMREIRAYPQPIAGCDAQIPALWERRDAISAELAHLESAARDPAPDAIAAFLADARFIGEADRRKLLDQVAQRVAAAPAPPAAAE